MSNDESSYDDEDIDLENDSEDGPQEPFLLRRHGSPSVHVPSQSTTDDEAFDSSITDVSGRASRFENRSGNSPVVVRRERYACPSGYIEDESLTTFSSDLEGDSLGESTMDDSGISPLFQSRVHGGARDNDGSARVIPTVSDRGLAGGSQHDLDDVAGSHLARFLQSHAVSHSQDLPVLSRSGPVWTGPQELSINFNSEEDTSLNDDEGDNASEVSSSTARTRVMSPPRRRASGDYTSGVKDRTSFSNDVPIPLSTVHQKGDQTNTRAPSFDHGTDADSTPAARDRSVEDRNTGAGGALGLQEMRLRMAAGDFGSSRRRPGGDGRVGYEDEVDFLRRMLKAAQDELSEQQRQQRERPLRPPPQPHLGHHMRSIGGVNDVGGGGGGGGGGEIGSCGWLQRGQVEALEALSGVEDHRDGGSSAVNMVVEIDLSGRPSSSVGAEAGQVVGELRRWLRPPVSIFGPAHPSQRTEPLSGTTSRSPARQRRSPHVDAFLPFPSSGTHPFVANADLEAAATAAEEDQGLSQHRTGALYKEDEEEEEEEEDDEVVRQLLEAGEAPLADAHAVRRRLEELDRFGQGLAKELEENQEQTARCLAKHKGELAEFDRNDPVPPFRLQLHEEQLHEQRGHHKENDDECGGGGQEMGPNGTPLGSPHGPSSLSPSPGRKGDPGEWLTRSPGHGASVGGCVPRVVDPASTLAQSQRPSSTLSGPQGASGGERGVDVLSAEEELAGARHLLKELNAALLGQDSRPLPPPATEWGPSTASSHHYHPHQQPYVVTAAGVTALPQAFEGPKSVSNTRRNAKGGRQQPGRAPWGAGPGTAAGQTRGTLVPQHMPTNKHGRAVPGGRLVRVPSSAVGDQHSNQECGGPGADGGGSSGSNIHVKLRAGPVVTARAPRSSSMRNGRAGGKGAATRPAAAAEPQSASNTLSAAGSLHTQQQRWKRTTGMR